MLPLAHMTTHDSTREKVRRALERDGMRQTARTLGVHHSTLARVAAGRGSDRTLAMLAERVKDRVRTSDEFAKVARNVRAPRSTGDIHAWSLERIRAARDEQMRGKFQLPVKLAAAMRTNGELFVAYHTRTAPVGALGAHLKPAAGARGVALQRKAAKSVIIPRGVLLGIAGTRANHALAIGHVVRESNAEGTLVDMRLEEWPLEFVYWDTSREMLMTRTDGGPDVPIIHGDGEWIVFKKYDLEPWKQDACILPGGLLWAALAGAIKDWNLGATSHGQAKMIAQLPEGFTLQNADGLTADAAALLALLQGLVSGENGAGVVPNGTEVDFVSNNSSAWQVFSQLVDNREKIATRIYLGTDAILGATGGAPGVDIAALFRVASTIVQGDLDVICDGINIGMLQPWAAINDGDSRNAPTLEFRMPDPDAAAVAAERDAKEKQLVEAIERRKAAGFDVTQEVVDDLAAVFGVTPSPKLASSAPPAAFTLAPTDAAKVVLGKEARASLGLPPFNDKRDTMTLTQIDALADATGEAQAPAAPPAGAPAP